MIKGNGIMEEYDITYNLNGGALTGGASNPDTYTAATPTFTLSNPVKKDYDFTGWVGTGLKGPAMTVTIKECSAGDRSYAAQWGLKHFYVKFVTNGGSQLETQKVAIHAKAAKPKNPTRKGYTFAGWYADKKRTKTFSFKTKIEKNTTLYAKWKAKETVTAAQKKAAKIALDAGTKAISSGNKVTASRGAVKGANSYVIYANYCGKEKCRKFKTVSGKTTSFVFTKLNGRKFNQKKNLKFYVVAYKTVKGKKVKLARSIMAHAPGSKNSRYTNVTGVKVRKAAFTLKKGKTARIKAKLVLQKKNKKPLKHEAEFRFATSNAKVAKVSKKGKITAVGKGKCTVYVYAISGVSKKIKVTVR
jgi:uncharacterized repeat protein (TIGR02543 family)